MMDGYDAATQLLNRPGVVLPALIVFDLDYTLWDGNCCEHNQPRLYPQVKGILNALKDKAILMAVASWSDKRDAVETALKQLLAIDDFFFTTKEIQRGVQDKREHFQEIHKSTGIPYCSMLFFDDRNNTIEVIQSVLGTTCVLIEKGKGLTVDMLKLGLENYAKKSKSAPTIVGGTSEENSTNL